jgi:hypothetical protein
MGTNNLLISKIEEQRKVLIELAASSTYCSPEVIEASVTLDQMLNQYDINTKRKQ